MAAEKPDENGEAWLDALAGRPAGVDADAAALRDLLLPIPDAQAPDWQTLRAHAEAPATPLRRVAANEGRWWPRVGVAAAVLVLVGVVFNFRQHDERPQLRGGSGTPHAVAVWLVDDPDTAALTLATELRALGAEVQAMPKPEAVVLSIAANPAAALAVNRRLSVLEAGLDAEGRTTLTVRRAPP